MQDIGEMRGETTSRGGGDLSVMLGKRRRQQVTSRGMKTYRGGNDGYQMLGIGEMRGGTTNRGGGDLCGMLGRRRKKQGTSRG